MKRKIAYILLFLAGMNTAPCFWGVLTVITKIFFPAKGIGIIGGADAPTAMFLLSMVFNLPNVTELIIGIGCLIAAMIILNKERHRD